MYVKDTHLRFGSRYSFAYPRTYTIPKVMHTHKHIHTISLVHFGLNRDSLLSLSTLPCHNTIRIEFGLVQFGFGSAFSFPVTLFTRQQIGLEYLFIVIETLPFAAC